MKLKASAWNSKNNQNIYKIAVGITNKIERTLRESGEFHDYENFLVYGNPVNPKSVIIFEKGVVLEKAIRTVGSNPDFLFVSGLGVPSQECLEFIRKIQAKNFYFFGDMDPLSFFIYLVLKYCKRMPLPKGKTKLNIKYAGITLADYKKCLSSRNVLIKLRPEDSAALDFLKDFSLPELKKEIGFLKDGSKVEIDAFVHCFDDYIKRKFSKL